MVMIKLPATNSPTIQVPPTHLAGSRLLFCGESAGKEEVRLRKGFSGSSGQMLRRIAKSAGIDFDQCALTNVIKEMPIGGSIDSYYLDKKKNGREQPGDRIQWWWKLLEAEISQYNNYHLVVALGDEALYALTGLRGITKWRGSILSCKFKPSLKVIPDVHPSYIMRDNWADYYIAIRNAKKWKEEIKLPQRLLKEPADEFIIRPTLDQALEWIEFIAKPPYTPWYLDVETVGDSLRCFGLSSDARPRRAICIPIHTSTGPYWSVRDEATIWSQLSLAASRNPLFRNQNCVYDLDYILDMGVEPSQIDFDPMVGMNVAYPEFPKGLDFTTSIFTYYEYYKDEGKTWKKKEPDEKVWTYNCLAPTTKVLKSDLTWQPIGLLQPGDELIGIDELPTTKNGRRLMRANKVVKIWKRQAECFEIKLVDGRKIIATNEHPFLCQKLTSYSGHEWRLTEELNDTFALADLTSPWPIDTTYEGGWLSGLYDGEGCVSRGQVQLAQKSGAILDKAIAILHGRGWLSYQAYKKTDTTTWNVVGSNLRECLELLGSLRPVRLLPKARGIWEGRYPFQGHKPIPIHSVTSIGEQIVVGIETTGGTYNAEGFFTHNCKDMVATPKVSNAVIRDLKEKKLYECYQQRAGRMLPIALEMQRNRLLLDLDWYSTFSQLLETEREKTHNELTALVGRDINVKSTPEVGELLFNKLKLPTKFKRGSGGKITTDENAIKELRAVYPDIPELNLILKERHLRTKLSNYINVKFDVDADGSRYLPYMGVVGGAKTGRWAFSKSPKWRGSSPQIISKVMRLMYQPPLGSVFWQRDLSQAEARIVAWLAECRFLLSVFDSPIKIHKVVGGKIFKKPPDEIISDSMEYDISKRVVHAYNYMMQAKKLAVTANLPLPFAEWTLEEYGKQVPEIKEWHKKIKQTAIATGRLVTPMGRIRECFAAASAVTHTGQLPDEILRDLVSYIPQSTVPDLTNECMWKLWSAFPTVKWHQQGHDSFLASGPHKLTREFYERAERFADIHFIINGRDCHIPGEFQWGYRWGALLKYIPGEDTTYEAWEARATKEGYFELEGKNGIKEKLYSLLT